MELRENEGSSSRSIKGHMMKAADSIQDWSNKEFLRELRELVKDEHLIYAKSKYKIGRSNLEKYRASKASTKVKKPKIKKQVSSSLASLDYQNKNATMTFKKIDGEFKKGCLRGYTFCIAGVFYLSKDETEQLTRDDLYTMIVRLGGKITLSVDEGLDYLILGNVLEDGRSVEEGSKYVKARKINRQWEQHGIGFPIQIYRCVDEFVGLLRSFSDE